MCLFSFQDRNLIFFLLWMLLNTFKLLLYLVWVSYSFDNKVSKPGWLKITELFISYSWRFRVQNQGVIQSCLFDGLGESPFMHLAFGICWQSFHFHGLKINHCSKVAILSLCVFIPSFSSLSVFVYKFSLYESTIQIRGHPNDLLLPCFNWITCVKTPFV